MFWCVFGNCRRPSDKMWSIPTTSKPLVPLGSHFLHPHTSPKPCSFRSVFLSCTYKWEQYSPCFLCLAALLLNMFSRLTHVVACFIGSFFCLLWVIFHYMKTLKFIYFLVNEHLDCWQFLVMNLSKQLFTWTCVFIPLGSNTE